MARFRHPRSGRTGAMPYVISDVGRSVGLSGSWGHDVQVLGWSPTGHLRTVQRRVDCSDVLQCRHRRVAHGWLETVGAGTKKSGVFYSLLRWSVGRHWLLRSRWTHSRQRSRTRQSALTLIAFQALTIRCWFRFAVPGRQGQGGLAITECQPFRSHRTFLEGLTEHIGHSTCFCN